MVKYRKRVENRCSHVPKRTTPIGGARHSEHILPTSIVGASIEWVNILKSIDERRMKTVSNGRYVVSVWFEVF